MSIVIRSRAAHAAILLFLCNLQQATAADPQSGTGSRAARQDAIAAIPFDRLDPDQRARVSDVVSDASLFRRLPTTVIQCDPDLYLFVVEHPEILANVWELLEIDDVILTPSGPNSYRATDAGATLGNVEYLYRSHDTQLIYAEGSYDGPLFAQPVEGRCVLLLKIGYIREPDGQYYITARLDTFIQLDNLGQEFFAKTFQPLVARVADTSIIQTAGFIESLSRAAELNRQGMHRLAGRLNHVGPEVREQFVAVTAGVAAKARLRQAARPVPRR